MYIFGFIILDLFPKTQKKATVGLLAVLEPVLPLLWILRIISPDWLWI